MKKSLIFVGMLAIGYANAQEGNVGINTETPKATLEITPNATNLTGTTNEGLLIPRLTKARVVAIAADKLVEGTKVYVTDEVTAADTQFIGAGKGFYFYNGTKWVKQLASDTDTNSELWAQRDNAGVTETYLKPADEKTDFVGYKDNGTAFNIVTKNNKDLEYLKGLYTETNTDSSKALSSVFGTHNLLQISENTTLSGSNTLRLDMRAERGSKNNVHYGIFTSSEVISGASIDRLYGFRFSKGLQGIAKNSVKSIYGIYIDTITEASENNYAIYTGTNGIVRVGDKIGVGLNAPTERIETNGNILANGGLIASLDQAVGGYLELRNPKKDTGKEVSRWRIYNMTDKDPANNYVPGLHFWSYGADGTNLSSQMVITDAGNVGIGFGSRTNISTQTNEKLEVNGNVRIVGLKGTGDRVVYADENGVLKTGGSIASNNGVQNETGMTCTAANAGKINYTTIQKDGKDVGVFGFCMQKGTDYVWAYMLGGSNIYGTSANGAAFGQGL